uniref:Activin_recp domain-containing protein n=1 Tax=Strongyloides papillosus TaxID=174720 RepID=A0A0N5CAG3_STREA
MVKIKIIFVLIILSNLSHLIITLGCFRSSNHINRLPIHDRYCKFNTPYCVKVTEGEYSYRNCDDLNVCVSLGNRCVSGVSYGGKYGELCCCSGDHCNSSIRTILVLNNKYCMLLFLFFTVFVNYHF